MGVPRGEKQGEDKHKKAGKASQGNYSITVNLHIKFKSG